MATIWEEGATIAKCSTLPAPAATFSKSFFGGCNTAGPSLPFPFFPSLPPLFNSHNHGLCLRGGVAPQRGAGHEVPPVREAVLLTADAVVRRRSLKATKEREMEGEVEGERKGPASGE